MLKSDNYKKYYSTALVIIAIAIIAFVIMMISPLNPLCKGEAGTDNSVFHYVALVMSKGGMPYKDVFDHKGPLLYIINYLGFLISHYRGVWVVEYISMFIFLVITYKTARLFCGRAVSILVVILCASPLQMYLGNGNFTEEYALGFIALGMYIFLDYFLNLQISKYRLIICGVCLAAVLMLLVNLAAIWVVFPIAVLIKCIRKKSSEWVPFLLWFILGMMIVLIPIFIWLIANGAFGDFINDYIIFNLKYSSDEARTTILNRYNSFTEFLGDSLLIGAIVINITMILKDKEYRLLNYAYLMGILISLLATAISGRTYNYYGMVIIPLLVYPYSWLFGSQIKEIKAYKPFIAFLLVTLVYSQWQTMGQTAVTQVQNYIDGKSNVFSNELKNVLNIIDENTTEDDKIIVLGNKDIYYILSGRLAASKYSYQSPVASVDEEIKEEFLNDMETNSPAVVVMAGDYYELFPNSDDYDMVYSFVEGDKTTKVYLPRLEN